MPDITFSFTNAQVTRITAAKNVYNELNGTLLTNKQYLLAVIKDEVRARILGDVGDDAVKAAAGSLENDLGGDA